MIKYIISITVFFLISNMGVCSHKWNCIYENMPNNPVGSCWNRDGGPIYDPVNDEIVLCSRYSDYGPLYISRMRNNQWAHKEGLPIGHYFNTNLQFFEERSGTNIYFGLGSIDRDAFVETSGFDYQLRSFNNENPFMELFFPRYISADLNAGSCIFGINTGEDICRDSDSLMFQYSNDAMYYISYFVDEAAPMTFDEKRNVVVKYGNGDWVCVDRHNERYPGFTISGRLEEWDGKKWTRRDDIPEPHPPKSVQRMVYDESRGLVLLVDCTGQSWEYDGVKWYDKTNLYGSEIFKNAQNEYGLDIYGFYQPFLVYDSSHNRIILFVLRYKLWEFEGNFEQQEMWALEDDASTQTYSRRNVMEEGCEPRTWGETGVDCSFTSSTSWSRIIVVKTEDETAPRIGDTVTSGVWAADALWEIKTDRPPDIDASETTGTLISISYTPEIVDRICSDTSNLQLFIARPDEAIGVPISDALRNDMRSFEQWQTLPSLDHPPAPGEPGVFHDIPNRRFLFRCVMKAPFYGSPSGLPQNDGQPASLCYAIGTTDPDFPQMIKSAILGRAKYTEEERTLLDSNNDARLDIADLIHILGQ